jgi:CBS domain-containing protein
MNANELVVADVMTIDPIVVNVDATLEDAARLLHTNSISGLPVVDQSGTLVGVLSQTDLLAITDSPLGRLIRSRPSGIRVGELMSAPAITVPLTSALDEAARIMIGSRVHRLVATDESGRPVGVLSALDFVALYAEG